MEELQTGPWTKFKKPEAQPLSGPWEKFRKAPEVTPGLLSRNPGEELPQASTLTDPLERFDQVMARYQGKPITKEVILADEELMGFVRENVRGRFKDRNLLVGAGTAAAGGAGAYGWEKMSDEDLFETWQEYHRSFAGGQTVTTANEIAYASTADDQQKALLGLGYKLFDSMDNAFTGSGTWSETFDATGDYMQAGLWDPATVLSLGVGKAFAFGGSKAASVALRAGAKTAFEASIKAQAKRGITGAIAQTAAREAADQVMKQGFKAIGTKTVLKTAEKESLQAAIRTNLAAGMTKEAAEVAARKALATVSTRGTLDLAKKEALRFGVASGAVDLVTSVGSDAANQSVKIMTGAQEDFSIPQSALAALGVLVTPALVAGTKALASGVSKVAGKNFSSYKALQQDYIGKDPTKIMDLMKSKIDLTQVNQTLQGGMDDFLKNLNNGVTWPQAKAQGKALLQGLGQKVEATPDFTDFMQRFMFGYTDTKNKTYNGYVYELARAGFRYVQRDREDTPTHFLADAVEWLDDAYVEKMLKGYEQASGTNLGVPYTAKGFAAKMRTSISLAGSTLRLPSVISKILKDADNPTLAAEVLAREAKDAKGPAFGAWTLSVWKRMVTSHPATTGLNIKGWSGLSLMNTTSDLVQGMLEVGYGTFLKTKGDNQAATIMIRRGKGSLLGLARRGFNILDWNATMKEADAFLQYDKKTAEELFRQGTGEAGSPMASLGDFNIKPNVFTSGVESIVGGAQKATGVILQDEVTKKLSFMTALDRQIMREYGQSYGEFMSRPDKWAEMATEKFQGDVISRALDRTLRETASKSWQDKKGSNFALWGAKLIEQASNQQALGYAIPFGRFFNTATATLGDFSMVNAVRHAAKKARGAKIDAAQDEGVELLAKGVAGWSTVMGFSYLAIEKVEEGLAWNQERREDGSIEDLTYDFPESFWRIGAQFFAHVWKDREVPTDLYKELLSVYGAQTFRASQEGIETVMNIAEEVVAGNVAEGASSTLDVVVNFMGGIISGVTRPLDPLNTGAMMITGDYSQPDRRQGNVFYNEATRYIDKIFSLPTEEQRNIPTRGPNEKRDVGAMLGGVRSTSENTPSERMMGSIGRPSWKAVKWDGEPEVKNRLDGLLAPILNTYAELALAKHPEYFSYSLEDRQNIWKTLVEEPAKKKAQEQLGMSGGNDQLLELSRQIAGEGQGKVQKVLGKLGYPSVSEILREEGAKEKLETLLYMLKNYERLELK